MYPKLGFYNLIAIICFYLGAGINHFWHPLTYNAIVPPYFPYPEILVKLSGVFEIILGVLLIFNRCRKLAAVLIIVMLFAFIPVHVYMIQLHGCVSITVCIPEWVAWVRLFPLQFILMVWVWKTFKWSKPYGFVT